MNRYIVRRIIWLFLASVIGLVLFTSLTLAVQLSDLILTRSESLISAFKLLGLKVPDFLGFALPIGLIVSTFIVLARLIHDREILAFQLGGYSLKRIAFPIILIGLLVSLATFGLNNFLVPWSSFQYRKKVYQITKDNPLPRIQSDLFFKDPNGRTIYVGRYLEEEKRVEDVLLFHPAGLDIPGLETGESYPELLTSKSGSLTKDGWLLSEGQLIGLDESGKVSYTIKFEGLKINIADSLENLVFSARKPAEMGARKLWERARAAARSGKASARLRFAFHTRLAQSLSALIFVLFSVPLSLLLRHRSRAVGILLALLSVAGYQGVLLWAKSSVTRSSLSPVLGAWLPDALFGGLGLLLFCLLDRRGFRELIIRSKRDRDTRG